MYRSPSQSSIEFESFLSGFEDMLSSGLFSKSQFQVVLGDFNARSSTWCSNDITNLMVPDSLTATHGFPANICWSWRRLQDVLKTSWRHVLKTSWRYALKTSWRHYGEKQNTYWGYPYLTNLYLTNLHLTILRRIQNALSRIHHFNICLILELKQHLYLRIKISDDFWCCKIIWIKIRHCKKGEPIKANF